MLMKVLPKTESVHPHVRGEHILWVILMDVYYGSSPRTWGTWMLFGDCEDSIRFIPTYVGNMIIRYSSAFYQSVHPHVRGEHHKSKYQIEYLSGSSPRTWGTLTPLCEAGKVFRFIPTYVGNMYGVHWVPRWQAVHPHVRGEHVNSELKSCVVLGSSPRTWGTFLAGKVCTDEERFIPTYVGNIRTLRYLK